MDRLFLLRLAWLGSFGFCGYTLDVPTKVYFYVYISCTNIFQKSWKMGNCLESKLFEVYPLCGNLYPGRYYVGNQMNPSRCSDTSWSRRPLRDERNSTREMYLSAFTVLTTTQWVSLPLQVPVPTCRQRVRPLFGKRVTFCSSYKARKAEHSRGTNTFSILGWMTGHINHFACRSLVC